MIPGVDKVPECDPIEPLYCPTGEKGASECNNMRSLVQTSRTDRNTPWECSVDGAASPNECNNIIAQK
jgi:hypothetical protein